MKRAYCSVALMGLFLPLLGCSGQNATIQSQIGLNIPTAYDADMATAYSKLGDEGYQLLDEGKVDDAVAAFTKQYELIPAGKWGAYNVACAYGRNGTDVEKGLEWLTKAVDNDWDDPGHLNSDGDLESIRSDPRFASLLEKAERNERQSQAPYADGLPVYHDAPVKFASMDEYDQWVADQNALIRKNRSVWQGGQNTAYRMDFESKRLAALRELQKDDPEFDYGLERVRALAKMNSIWSSWGPMADGVLKEVRAYLASNPGVEGRSEAEYRAAVASICKDRPTSPEDEHWASATAAAREHFDKVAAGTKYEGAAQAWLIAIALDNAGENRKSVLPRVRSFAEKFGKDEPALDIAGSFFQGDMVASVWPIPIKATDIDGKSVSLDDYKGKVVLVDFWATWCGPCRAELPHILAAYDEFKQRGFEVLSISLDYADRTSQDEYRQWITEKGMNWRHIYDEKDWNGDLVNAYMVKGIPSPFLIDRNGNLLASGEEVRGEKLEEAIEAALKQTGV